MRVRQCCCGCSLQTGTLILLWLGLIGEISQIVKGLAAVFGPRESQSVLEIGQLPWSIISLVVIIYAIVGVEKKRPSFLLPYVIMSVVGLILLAIATLAIFIGSIAIRDAIIGYAIRNLPNIETHSKADDVKKAYNAIVSIVVVLLIICLAFNYYFTIVVYSFYKQMQEDPSGGRTDGMIYAAPPDQQTKGMAYNDYPPAYGAPTAPHPQQNLAYPHQNPVYPQQNPVYPQQNPVYPQQSQVYPQLPGVNQ